jgi:hypothetical protein
MEWATRVLAAVDELLTESSTKGTKAHEEKKP